MAEWIVFVEAPAPERVVAPCRESALAQARERCGRAVVLRVQSAASLKAAREEGHAGVTRRVSAGSRAGPSAT